MRLSLVVPVLDEAENVDAACDEIVAAFTPLNSDYEIIFVDDGSTDGTASRVVAARDRLGLGPRLRCIRNTPRAGKSAALRTGITAARAPWIATIDGDGQDDPSEIPPMLETAEQEGAVVAGLRLHRRRD